MPRRRRDRRAGTPRQLPMSRCARKILSYSRSRGLFAGISLEGSTLRPDNDANEKVYGKKVTGTEIIRQRAVPIPPSGRKLVSLVEKKSPKNHSDPESLK